MNKSTSSLDYIEKLPLPAEQAEVLREKLPQAAWNDQAVLHQALSQGSPSEEHQVNVQSEDDATLQSVQARLEMAWAEGWTTVNNSALTEKGGRH